MPARALLTTLAFVGGLFSTGVLAAPAKSFADLRRAGQEAYRANKFADAEALFRAASSMRPDDGEVWLDVAMCSQHLGKADEAVAANRQAIRLASKDDGAGSARRRRVRRAAYFNLGKLAATRKLEFPNEEGTCMPLPSDLDCRRPIYACGRTSAFGVKDVHQDYTMARFALDQATASAEDQGGLKQVLDTYPELGASPESTKDAADGYFYGVTLSFYSQSRQTIDGEAGVEIGSTEATCLVVHVDGCARRLGIFCRWQTSSMEAKPRSRAAAIELTFADATDSE
jgi:tetratricopeptide (TPR) repeat protein